VAKRCLVFEMHWLFPFLTLCLSSTRALHTANTLSTLTIISSGLFAYQVAGDAEVESPTAYNVIFRRDVGIAALHKFAAELKKRTLSKDFPDFKVSVDKVLTNMKLIKIIDPSPDAWKFISTHKFVKEYYATPAVDEL
jgi:hypothetical protein